MIYLFDRNNHNVHIHGYRETEISQPIRICVLSEMDRFHVAKDAAVGLYTATKLKRICCENGRNCGISTTAAIREHGEDIPEVVSWQWENVNK